MTIERGDNLFDVRPDPDLRDHFPAQPSPKMSIIEKLSQDIAGDKPDPLALGIGATIGADS